MTHLSFRCPARRAAALVAGLTVLSIAFWASTRPVSAGASAWSGFAGDAQHSGLSQNGSQSLARIHWHAPVDLHPQYNGGELLVHYGAPLVTAANTVILPVKTGAAGSNSGFRVEGRSSSTGTVLWSLTSDFTLPSHNWIPEFGPVMTSAVAASPRVYLPGAGGTLLYRDSADSAAGAQGRVAFYGLSNYNANPSRYSSSVKINTPLTADAYGNIYFGFVVTGTTPVPLKSGIARINPSGAGTWVSVTSASGDSSMTKVVHNCAPALSADGSTVYVAVSNGRSTAAGYLLALSSASLQTQGKVRLKDPKSGKDAWLSDDGSAAPTVDPVSGDVFYGVLENPFPANNDRGWLLHFNATLSASKTPGAFGWDDTASLVPTSMVPSYTTASPHLLMTKYNNYIGVGTGNGQNRIAIVDPGVAQTDPITGVQVMKEVITMLGPTPNPSGGVKEWCINTAAVDPLTQSVIAGSEDGRLYRWNLATNTLTEALTLTPGLGEAYTPTLIGADGTVYAINNATLFAIGQ